MKRTIMYIFIAIIIVALVFSVGLLKEKDNSDSNLKTIQLNEVTRSVFYAPQYVAIENEYFEEQGLKLEITTGQGADKVMTAILAGQSDMDYVDQKRQYMFIMREKKIMWKFLHN